MPRVQDPVPSLACRAWKGRSNLLLLSALRFAPEFRDPDAFNHDTEEFSAIAATLIRHNAISEALSTRPESFEPLFVRSWDGEVDAQPWCMGFYAVMKLRLLAWSRLISPDRSEHHLLLPILFHCVDDAGRPAMPLATPRCASNAWRDIPATVEALGQFWMPIRF